MRRTVLLTAAISLQGVLALNVTDDASLFWGTYRPNLYFGLKPRLPLSLLTGLAWFGLNDYNGYREIRHSCEQGDGLAGYTWTEHDLRQGGIQVLKDPKNNLELTTELLKFPGGEHGGSWAARIKGRPMDPSHPSKNSLIFSVAIEGLGSLGMDTAATTDGLESAETTFSGSSIDLGDFQIRFVHSESSQMVEEGQLSQEFRDRIGKTHYVGRSLPAGTTWMTKDMIYKAILEFAMPIATKYQEQQKSLPEPAFLLALPDDITSGSNIYAIQKQFEGEFTFDIFYESASGGHRLDASVFEKELKSFKDSFDHRFEHAFPISPSSPPGLVAFSKAITSNLLGGIGYFYGDSIVDASALDRDADEDDDEDQDGFVDDAQIKRNARAAVAPPRGLLTATPSRPFFPRGFYWDEGFHLLHIGAWDNDLSLEILKSWIDLIDENGWVGREQILGAEARSKVPEEFQMQFPTYANPPTLTMAVTAFIERVKHSSPDPLADQLGFADPAQMTFTVPPSADASFDTDRLLDPVAAREYLVSIYPALRRHYDWLRRTQRGQIKQWTGRSARARNEGYRWRGRSEEHVLTSGLDDYPRASSHIGELHLDLISWVGFFSRTMREIAEFLGESDDEQELRQIEADIMMNIDDLHWNEKEQMYCDASVDDDDESFHVCHRGYVSLFPFLLELLPASSSHLKPILDMISDPEQLWSPYGIRSLSKSHPLFGTNENYWRGPIWIQMNFLALRALHKTYAATPGPHQEQAKRIYDELRRNVIDNVFKEYERTGYVWEQYDAITGEGRRSHPFTGWTSLVTLIISEKY
ncbi:Processing alpha glucosidase I [Tulasnella sp. 330]|nr:Processing alpha glucosidase I [Tulasnella sp. 330]KAG8889943.1 Processing alpha glucosidase I [Tulasnella sp. 332]